MDHFAKIVNGSILDVLRGSEYGRYIAYCFEIFFGIKTSEIFSLLRKGLRVNVDFYIGFGERSSAKEFPKSLE